MITGVNGRKTPVKVAVFKNPKAYWLNDDFANIRLTEQRTALDHITMWFYAMIHRSVKIA